MASKPILPATPPVIAFSVPNTGAVAARPARAPESVIVMMITKGTLMPAVLAASGLAPAARISKPKVDRSKSHHTKMQARIAAMMLKFSRNPLPSSDG